MAFVFRIPFLQATSTASVNCSNLTTKLGSNGGLAKAKMEGKQQHGEGRKIYSG